MMTVLGCIVDAHNIWLVIVAALLCAAGSWVTSRLFLRTTSTGGVQRLGWQALTAVTAGVAIWCTHFVAMLGYEAGVSVSFDTGLTVVSLMIAVAGSTAGFAIAGSGASRFAPALGGAVVGLAIAVMHYVGMMAYRVQGLVSWDMTYLVASIVLSVGLSAAALHVALNATRHAVHMMAGILALAIVVLHFTGMTAFRVEPLLIDSAVSNPQALHTFAVAVAGMAFVIVGVGLVSYLIDDDIRVAAGRREEEHHRRLQRELDFSNAALNGLPGVFYHFAEDGRFLRWNRNFEQVTGYSPEELAGMNALDFFADEDKALVAGRIAEIYEKGKSEVAASFVLKDGRHIPYLFTGVYFENEGQRGFIGVALDMSERKAIEQRLREERDFSNAMLDSLPGIFYHYDHNMRLIRWNKNHEQVTGRSAEELMNMHPLEFFAEEERELVASRIGDIFADGQSSVEANFLVKGGHTAPYLFTGMNLQLGGQPTFVGIGIDISARKRAEDRVRQLAEFDMLTGLPNRNTFNEELAFHLAAPGSHAGLLYVDLDGFKLVNDTRGHKVGDTLLGEVADRLRAECDGAGVKLARLGGDEFVVLVPHNDADKAIALADRIVAALSAPYDLDYDRGIQIGASIGIAFAPDHAGDGGTLLSRADIALYSAKAAGKGIAKIFQPEMETRIQERTRLEEALRATLDDMEGLFVFYQPIVDIDTGKVTAREALVRWHHPERGWISPAEFVPVAEQSGLIDRLGLFVLNRACQDAAGWEDGARVAVNISAGQLGKGTLAPIVLEALVTSGLSPQRLEIEVTETALLADEDQTIADLRRVRDMGVRVALDDFGTGYSSLAHLRVFPFDKIKIDGTFVRDAVDRPESAAVVQTIAELGRRLGVTTVAEGVETQAQLDRVREEGCTEIQGYLYGRPAPNDRDAAKVEALTSARGKTAAA